MRKRWMHIGFSVSIFGMLWLICVSISAYSLHWAARAGDLDRMRSLLARGADPNRRVFRVGYEGEPTPMMFAIEGRQPDAIRLLASYGADLKPVRPGTPTLLTYALHDYDVVAALLEVGVDPNVRYAPNDETVLLAAMFLGRCQIAALLIVNGADVSLVDAHGNTSLDGALSRCIDHMDELVPLMVERGLDVDVRLRWDNATALMIASRHGRPETVRVLLEAGADLLLFDTSGRTALEWARQRNDEHQENVIELLRGASQRR
jgi:ankyrin repeat protein